MSQYKIKWRKFLVVSIFWVIYALFEKLYFSKNYYGLFYINNFTVKLLDVSTAIFIILLTKTFNDLTRVFFWDLIIAKVLNGLAPYLLIQITALLAYFIATLFIIGVVFDQSVASFITMFGAFGIVLGLGIQRLILDAFSGITINIDTPFSLGDFIQITVSNKQYFGQVTGISWRLTSIITPENTKVTFPNSIVSGAPIINYSKPTPVSEFEQTYYFPHSVDQNFIEKKLYHAALSLEKKDYIVPKSAKVRLSEIKPECLGFKIKYLVDPLKMAPGKVKHNLHTAVLKHIKAAGLSFYSPQDRYIQNISNAIKEKIPYDYLAENSVFSVLSIDELKKISDASSVVFFPAESPIVNFADETTSMYVIIDGIASVYIPVDNELRMVAILHPGDFFGEMALFTGEPRKATVISESNLIAIEIKKEELYPVLKNNTLLYEVFSKVIVDRETFNVKDLKNYKKSKETEKKRIDFYIDKIRSFFLHP